MIRTELKIQKRAERINNLLSETTEKLNEFSTMLHYFALYTGRFNDTGIALRTGTGEVEIF